MAVVAFFACPAGRVTGLGCVSSRLGPDFCRPGSTLVLVAIPRRAAVLAVLTILGALAVAGGCGTKHLLAARAAKARSSPPALASESTSITPLDPLITAVSGGVLIVPVEIKGSIDPAAAIPARLSDGTPLDASLAWIGTEDEPAAGAPSKDGDEGPSEGARAWVDPPPHRRWVVGTSAAAGRSASRGAWAVVATLPRSPEDRGAGAPARTLRLGDGEFPLIWLDSVLGAAVGPRVASTPVPEAVRRAPTFAAALRSQARSPATRWRSRLALGTLFVPGSGAEPAPDAFADPVLEALAVQIESRWRAALTLLAQADADRAARVCQRLRAFLVFGGGAGEEGVVVPAWPGDDAGAAALLAQLLAPGRGDRATDRIDRARVWLAAQPEAIAWVVDDAGSADAVTGGVVSTLGIANLGQGPVAARATPDDDAGAQTDLVSVESAGAHHLTLVTPPPPADGAHPSPQVAARIARDGSIAQVRAGLWSARRRVFSRPLPAVPPGVRLGPLQPDWSAQRWLGQGSDVAPPTGGVSPRADDRASARAADGVQDPAWVAGALFYRADSPPSAHPASAPFGAAKPLDASATWVLYVECRFPAPAIGSEIRQDSVPGPAPEADWVRVWFGPFGAPNAVIRVLSNGATIDETAWATHGGSPSAPAPSTPCTRGPDRWAFWLAVPPAAVGADGVVRLGIERVDLRGVRAAWPRPMLPWQREPGRIAIDSRTWGDPHE